MPSSTDRRKYVLFGAIAAVGAAVDQATKAWVRGHEPPFGRAGRSVLGRGLVLVHAENPGIAFSQLQGLNSGRVVLSIVSLIALVLVVGYLRRMPSSRVAMVTALGLISGGAAGNLIDRAVRGVVTDFILVDLGFWPFHPWPVFNVADALLVAGVALMALSSLRARA